MCHLLLSQALNTQRTSLSTEGEQNTRAQANKTHKSSYFGLAPRCVTPSSAETLHSAARSGCPGLPSNATSAAPSTDSTAADQFHIICEMRETEQRQQWVRHE